MRGPAVNQALSIPQMVNTKLDSSSKYNQHHWTITALFYIFKKSGDKQEKTSEKVVHVQVHKRD